MILNNDSKDDEGINCLSIWDIKFKRCKIKLQGKIGSLTPHAFSASFEQIGNYITTVTV